MSKKDGKPEWVPDDAGREFTTHVMGGVSGGHDGMRGEAGASARPRAAVPRRRRLSVEEYVDGYTGG